MKINRIIQRTAALLAAILGLVSCSHSAPEPVKPAPKKPLASYLIMETYSGRVLYSGNPNELRPIGMLTNIATALVILDWIESSKISMEKELTVPVAACRWQKTNLLNLAPGDRITLRDALHSAIMWDDSACAETLAYACGSTINSLDPMDAFLNQLNQMGKTIGMKATNFKGASGAIVTMSDTYDMAKLGMYAMQKPVFRNICIKRDYEAKVNGSRKVKIVNSNAMLKNPAIDGIRAARSSSAGCCLMATTYRPGVRLINPRTGQEATYPQRLLAVVLGATSSERRYNGTAILLRDGWKAWEDWQKTDDFSDLSKFILLPR